MSDITNVFKATVKTVRVREKASGLAGFGSDKYIFPSGHRVKSDFTVHAQEVVLAICKLRDFLLQHRKEYLNANSHITGENSKLTDRDRDQIDADAKLYIRKCSDAINQLKVQARGHKVLPQVKEHKDSVLGLIDAFLRGVCQLYSEQQAVRVKRTVDRKRLSRLETVVASAAAEQQHSQKSVGDSSIEKTASPEALHQQSLQSNSAPKPISNGVLTLLTDDDEQISEEEAKLLQLENEQLYDEMSSMVDEVRQIEGKIVEIARLQEIFADKVLEQDKDINKIAETIVGSTENIKDGNEQIRQAMQNNAAFRIWILFVLIVCTLSLLFLDWYNA